MKDIDIISVESTNMGKYWVVTYKTLAGAQDVEMITAIDYNEAVVKFRNLMIEQQKSRK